MREGGFPMPDEPGPRSRPSRKDAALDTATLAGASIDSRNLHRSPRNPTSFARSVLIPIHVPIS